MKEKKNRSLRHHSINEYLLYRTTLFEGCEEKQIFSKYSGGASGTNWNPDESFTCYLDGTPDHDLRRLALEKDIPIDTLLNTAWGILLQKLSGCSDLFFAVGAAKGSLRRTGTSDMDSSGYFIYIRHKTHPDQDFISLLRSIRQQTDISESYGKGRFSRMNAAFFKEQQSDHILIYDRTLKRKRYGKNSAANLPVILRVYICTAGSIVMKFEFCSSILKVDFIHDMSRYLTGIITQVVQYPAVPLARIDILSEEAKRHILCDFNKEAQIFPIDGKIYELFAVQAGKTPDNTALIGTYNGKEQRRDLLKSDVFLTYGELDKASTFLSYSLIRKEVAAGEIVAIMVERSIEMIVAILAVLKARGAYLPLNPRNPAERMGFMLHDSSVRLVLTSRDLLQGLETLKKPGIEMIAIEDITAQKTPANCRVAKSETDTADLLQGSNSANPCYVIYTSGSTGEPKGVPITHGNISPLLHWGYKNIRLHAGDRVIQNLSYFFDWSVWEIFITLTSGASLVMISEEILLAPGNQVEFMNKNVITVLHITPSHFQYLLNVNRKLPTLRHLLLGAEKLTHDLVKKSRAAVNEECRIYNMYGPTEATIIATVAEVGKYGCHSREESSGVPIGKAIANMRLFISDRSNHLCPVFVPGELCIAGDGLAQGYLNNPELTIEKFSAAPNLQTPAGRPGSRSWVNDHHPELSFHKTLTHNIVYRTGDLARWLADGNVEFLGRIDHQVKIRGQRIELGEIENRLLNIPGIKDAAVVIREEGSAGKYLCAYFILDDKKENNKLPFTIKRDKGSLDKTKIRKILAAKLPDYMIPSYFVQLEKMPLNPNKKIDRKALPEPQKTPQGEFVWPQTEIEKRLAESWAEVLEIEKEVIGRNSDFFELGGHSLIAANLISRIFKEFKISLPLSEIFKFPTIKELAGIVEKQKKVVYKPIEPVEKRDYYDLSSAQKRMYIMQQQDPANTVYNISHVVTFYHKIEKERIERIFEFITGRHESMRTFFDIVDGTPVQRIGDDVTPIMEYFGVVRSDTAIEKIIRNFVKPFNLSLSPLLRIGLIETSGEKQILILDMHHIISDGVSHAVFIRDFIDLFAGFELSLSKLQYKDYSEWERGPYWQEKITHQGKYWLKLYPDEVPVADLPIDYVRPPLQSFAGDTLGFDLTEQESKELLSLAAGNNTTLYMVILSMFCVLLAKLCGSEDVVVATPTAGRRHPGIEHIIGMFVNTLLLRTNPAGDRTFSGFLKEVTLRTLEAFENQEFPFDELVKVIAPGRNIHRKPVFNVMFNMLNQSKYIGDISPVNENNIYKYKKNTSLTDLILIVLTYKGKLFFNFEYCIDLFSMKTIERFIRYFKKIATEITGDMEIKLTDIEIISEAEKSRVLYDFNDTGADYPADKTIYELFMEQAGKAPDNTALVFEDNLISYKGLHLMCGQLARLLGKKGVKADVVTGIMMERSIEMILGMLSVLAAGGAYLPLDQDNPSARNVYMLSDSCVQLVLTSRHSAENAKELNYRQGEIHEVYARDFMLTAHKEEPENGVVQMGKSPDNLAYVIYTSGTSGQPKGVPVNQKNVVNVVTWFGRQYNMTPFFKVLQMSSYTFDASVNQIFATLLFGGSLHIIIKNVLFDIENLRRYIAERRINLLNFVPVLLKELLETGRKLDSIKVVISGAERLDDKTKNRILQRGYALMNQYGPTETTIDALAAHCSGERVTLGRPIANTRCYVLDKYGAVLPNGVVGELYISGSGLSRGYLNNPELTAEKFVKMPAILHSECCDVSSCSKSNSRLETFEIPTGTLSSSLVFYRTGDLVKWLPEGEIEFLGRIDQQVKIRGYRIEPEEIKNRLLEIEGIKDSVVVAGEKPGIGKYLCAYIAREREIKIEDLRERLSNLLPDFMIPNYFVELDRLPLTANGKINRKLLPAPEIKLAKITPPGNDVEKKLTEIWAEVLGMENELIGIDNDFFVLGGHSLQSFRIVSRIGKELGIRIEPQSVFIHPTIRELAKVIKKSEKFSELDIMPRDKREYYNLSCAQEAIWLHSLFDENNTLYNLCSAFSIEGELNIQHIIYAIQNIVDGHEILRTCFFIKDERIRQKPAGNVKADIHFLDFSGEKNNSDLVLKELAREIAIPFEIEKAPLIKITLIRLKESEYIFLLKAHHLVFDGWSLEKFMSEIVRMHHILSEGKEIPENHRKIHYKDYIYWQQEWLKREVSSKYRDYWLDQLQGELPELDLLPGEQKVEHWRFDSEDTGFIMDKKTVERLFTLAQENNVTVFGVLLAVIFLLLHKYSGQNDIIIGVDMAGRNRLDLEELMGLFVNTVPVRIQVAPGNSFSCLLQQVKEVLFGAYNHQEYPVSLLAAELKSKHIGNSSPFFNVMASFNKSIVNNLRDKFLVIKRFPVKHTKIHFSLCFDFLDLGDTISGYITYARDCFNRSFIELLKVRFLTLLKEMSLFPGRPVSCPDLLTAEDDKNEETLEIDYDFDG